MKSRSLGTGSRAWREWVLLSVLATTGVTMFGCASNSAPPDQPITASDEPDTRRRARIRLELATGYFEQGKDEVALDEVKQAIAIDPSLAEAFNLRGLVAMRMNEPRLAEDSFRRALAINPRDGDAWHNQGWLLCQTRRFDEAQRSFDGALAQAQYRDRAKTMMSQGVCQLRAGQRDAAERAFLRSYEIDPASPITAYNLSQILYQKGDMERARVYLRRLNAGEFANAESLWLGLRVERRLGDQESVSILSSQLRRHFGSSRETGLLEQGRFND